MSTNLAHINLFSLQKMSVPELTKLVKRFPYFSLIKTILAQKNDVNNKENISIAATYSPDRSYLYVQGPSKSSQISIIENESMENVLENEILVEPLKVKDKHIEDNKNVISSDSIYEDVKISKFARWTKQLKFPFDVKAKKDANISDKILSDDIDVKIKKLKRKKIKIKTKTNKKTGDSKENSIEFALLSVKSDKTIVSQTLAIILENQKSYIDAIDMYKRLILKFPEKSAYFAKKIKKLNKKL